MRAAVKSGVFAALVFLSALMSTGAHANSKYAAYVVHAHSGDVLFDRYSNAYRYPASLTKMMTLYLLFDEIDAGRLSLSSKLKVSTRAAGQPPSKLGLAPGSKIDVETAIKALVVKSANDVASVVAENIAGSEWRFAQRMTKKARALGMRRTTFRNASGLPDKRQLTTARDMATLGRALMNNHPSYWPYFGTKTFAWKGRTYRTHNALVRSYPGADGLKTGYTRRSGYNLATTAKRNGHHLIGVVLGGRSSRTRDAHMRMILDNAFGEIRRKPTIIASLYRRELSPRVKPITAPLPGTITLATSTSGARGDTANSAAGAKVASLGQRTLAGDTSPDVIGALLVQLDEAGVSDKPDPQGEGDREPDLSWAVQIGAYADKERAQTELEEAASAISMAERKRVVQSGVTDKGAPIYRSRFTDMTESEAYEFCALLEARDLGCFPVQNTAR
ncbi:MAG: D-alanyl-D-alanine carboxypeptidase [Pseudomonadota bacterium]